MIKKIENAGNCRTILGWVGVLAVLAGCSSSSNLRKFRDDDVNKEIPPEVAKKFEVKEIGAPTPTPTAAPVSSKSKSKKKTAKKEVKVVTQEPVVPPTRRIDPMPFDVGEKLDYGIRYIGVTAAHFTIELLPLKIVNERKVYHLRGHAKTVAFFELMYKVDDIIESYWDYDGLYSTRFTMELDESKQSRKLIELYDYDKKKSYFWNRVDHSEKGFSEQKEQYDIALWSQDLLSSLYYLRAVELPKEAGKEFRFPVILDGKPWESVIRYVGKDKIYAGGKDREAIKYQIENLQNGEVKNRDNTIWISNDEHRYILRVEAKVKVGTFAVALDKIL